MCILSQRRSIALAVPLLLLSQLLSQNPANAAEQVTLTYGRFEFSVPIESLETYAKTGKFDRHLAPYKKLIPQDKSDRIRQFLQHRFDLNTIETSQLLYSDLGERTTTEFGEFIQTDSYQNGLHALRSAIISATADPEGLTPLNTLKKYPNTVKLNLRRIQIGLQAFNKIQQQTRQVISLTTKDNNKLLKTPPENLAQQGPQRWVKTTLTHHDKSRDRALTTDLYLPTTQTPVPVLIFSHSLGTDRANFTDLMEHLASQGFAVLALEHPGSSRQQIKNLLKGRSPEVMETNEFSDRPLDVTFLLDQLQDNPRLDFNRIGFIGHSLGGYTGLALAGAIPDFSHLRKSCQSHRITKNPTNPALVLQCLALNSPQMPSLADRRIRAVFTFNAIAGSIFGKTGLKNIQIPTMILSGTKDNIAPFISEQLCPYTQLTTPDKHFALIENGTHFYTTKINNLSQLTTQNPAPSTTRNYLKTLNLAFAKAYVTQESQYKSYLEAPYLQAISHGDLPLRSIDDEGERSIHNQICN